MAKKTLMPEVLPDPERRGPGDSPRDRARNRLRTLMGGAAMGLAACGTPAESDTAPPPPPTCDSSDLAEYRFEVDASAAWEPDPEDNTAWVVRSKFSFPDDIIEGTTGFSTEPIDTTVSGGTRLQTLQLEEFQVVARPADGATLMTIRVTFTCDAVRQTMDFNLDVRGVPMTGRDVPITAAAG